MSGTNFLRALSNIGEIITTIDDKGRFPETLDILIEKYSGAIETFCQLVKECDSSEEVLRRIRSSELKAGERMALLKIYRRCVSPVLDTENAKKIKKISTENLIKTYGHTFKPIDDLKLQFDRLSSEYRYALAALVGEYDTRGRSGYTLTGLFFDWFETHFEGIYTIEGPRGAGRDIELSELYRDYKGSFPCDFVIRRVSDKEVAAIGFARYDSTRGGAQSDDRTGGNANKVEKAKAFDRETATKLKMIFVADGPGLTHKDTWEEACQLDGQWNGRVRVVTLKLAAERITTEWLES